MNRLSDMTECCICLKTFTDPRMLPCIHTFCLQCLKDLIDKSNKKARDEINCPVCRKEFTIPNDGVQEIQKNFFMAGIIEVRNALNQSKVIPCDACKVNTGATEASISEATLRCLDCKHNLCKDCCKIHLASEGSENHKFMKIGNGTGVKEEVMTVNAMNNCDIHAGKILDYYCVECRKVVCASCFLACHRIHEYKEVTAVEEEFRQIIKFNADKISSLAGKLVDNKDTSESKEDFVGKIAKREQEILRRSEELKKMIDEHTNSLLSSLYEIKNRRMKEIKTKEDELDRRLTILESFSRYCDDLISKGSAIDICRNKDELQRRADELEEDHETYIMRPKTSFDVTLQATDLTEFLKTTNGNMIGSLNERDECLDDFAVVIGRIDSLPVLCKINLHRQNEVSTFVAFEPTATVWAAPAAAVYKNTMFITGFGDSFDEIWKYNLASGWKRCGTLVHGRKRHSAEFIGETLYIFGGIGDTILNSIESYNAMTEKSRVVGQLRCRAFNAACVAYKGLVFIFGGCDLYSKALDCVQVFNPVDRTCTLLSTSLPCPSRRLRAVSWKNFAIILTNDSCFIFDLDRKTWQDRNQFKMDGNSMNFGIIIYNKRLFVVYGEPRISKDNVMCIRAQCLVNNETPNWRIHGELPKEFDLIAIAQLSSAKQLS